MKNFRNTRKFLGSKEDPKLSLVTTLDFLTMRLHHIYSIQNNKEDINKTSKLLYMSQPQMCDFSYVDPWIAVARSLLWCVEWNSNKSTISFTLDKNACKIQLLSLDLTYQWKFQNYLTASMSLIFYFHFIHH